MTTEYEELFWKDMDFLNVRRPDAVLRVSEHMPEIINYVEKILDLEYAYVTHDGVYFDVSKWEEFSSNYDFFRARGSGVVDGPDDGREEREGAASLSSHGKRNTRDFALWKIFQSEKNCEEHIPSWDSPWGRGRPGW